MARFASQKLTGTGTIGIDRDNPNGDDAILSYVAYTMAAAGDPATEIPHSQQQPLPHWFKNEIVSY